MARSWLAADDLPSAEPPGFRLLHAMAEVSDREGLRRTAGHAAKASALLAAGASEAPGDALKWAISSDPSQEMVMARDVEFCSLCERHLLPFFGKAHVAYLPAGRVIERSGLPRLVGVFARRLQVQERLTEQVATAVEQAIDPRGVAVRLEAIHFCRMMRGVEKRESIALTSSFLGAFDRDMSLRRQFFAALGGGGFPREVADRAGGER